MVSNVNFNASAHVQNVSRPDEKLRNESNPVNENNVSDENAIVDVFTVSFWDRGVPKPEAVSGEAVKSVDITVDDGE
ncbi:MAG: hypothetical protein FWD38_01995 [Oscillospiraceae bacterium]|nr:hypothetical protein [Oscillospiraceae bacterium]